MQIKRTAAIYKKMEELIDPLIAALQAFHCKELSMVGVLQNFLHFFHQIEQIAIKINSFTQQEFSKQFVETGEALLQYLEHYIATIGINAEEEVNDFDMSNFVEWKMVQEATLEIDEIVKTLAHCLSTHFHLNPNMSRSTLEKQNPPSSHCKWIKS
jgi:hypothetical protein